MKIITLLILSILLSLNLLAKDINICTDDTWTPYTFVKDAKSVGIHIEIVDRALKNLNYKVNFHPLPWKRCLKYTELGKMDAVVSASYKDKRASFAYYPEDASSSLKSSQRIDQVEFSLLTRVDEDYIFDGNLTTIPQPVGIGLGSALGNTLTEKDIVIMQNNTIKGLLHMLLNKRTASTVLNSVLAKEYSKKEKFKGKFKVHQIPIKNKSYHIIFSKKSKINKIKREEIWNELVKIRQNKSFILKTLNYYMP